MLNYFTEVESDFYRYLTGPGRVNAHSRQNYLSWLKFLSNSYPLDSDLSDDDIANILSCEERLRREREIYSKKKDLVNFKSALRKYNEFLASDFRKMDEETILSEVKKIADDRTMVSTERTALTRARVGQGLFRERLISYWHGCSISAYSRYDILMASHIKPWRNSDNLQRLDVYNGLLLLPNFDKLFDKGYVSFGDNGKIIFSRYFPVEDRVLLGVNDSLCLIRVDSGHKPYLRYHRENCLMA